MPVLISYLLIALTTAKPLVASAAIPSGHARSRQIDYNSLRCPADLSDTLATPSYGTEGAIFTVCSELVIAAAPAAVYAAILDFRSYARWNTFVVDVALPNNISSTPDDVYVGMPMRFTSRGLLGDLLNTTSTEVVSLLGTTTTSSSLVGAWRYDDGVGGLGSRAEHPSVFVDLGNGSTRYVSYETYYAGLTTGTIALLREQLQDQWDVQARDLKSYVESL